VKDEMNLHDEGEEKEGKVVVGGRDVGKGDIVATEWMT
jgi:hypothetical protein